LPAGESLQIVDSVQRAASDVARAVVAGCDRFVAQPAELVIRDRLGGDRTDLLEGSSVEGDLHGHVLVLFLYGGYTTSAVQNRATSKLARRRQVADNSRVTRGQEPRDHKLTTRIPTSLWLALKRVAKEDDRSLSDWIVTTLTEVIASRDRERSGRRRQ